MWKKAAIRQIIKYIPKNDVPEVGKLEQFDNKVLSIKDDEIISDEIENTIPEIATENNSILNNFID